MRWIMSDMEKGEQKNHLMGSKWLGNGAVFLQCPFLLFLSMCLCLL